MDWIIENKEWLFSGIGVVCITTIGSVLFKRKKDSKVNQNIKSGSHSINIQSSSNVDVKNGLKENER